MSSPETTSAQPSTPAAAHPLDEIVSLVESYRGPAGADADAAFLALVARVVGAFVDYTARHPDVTIDSDALSATAAATACLRLLQAADLEVFELAMWQSWGGEMDITRLDPDRLRGTRR